MSLLPHAVIPLKRKPPRWRWQYIPVVFCDLLPEGMAGRLEIDGVVYVISAVGHLPEEGEPVVTGWRLENLASGAVYDINTSEPWGWTCDCRGFEAWGRCKHCVSVGEALASLNDPNRRPPLAAA